MVKILKNKNKLNLIPDIDIVKIGSWIVSGKHNHLVHKDHIENLNNKTLYHICILHPDRVREFLFIALKEKKTKIPSVITLAVLSSNNISSKKLFYEMFPKIITSVYDLLEFYYHVKHDHGITKRVKKTIVYWVKENTELLKRECDSKTFYRDIDISKIIHDYKPKPKDKKEIEIYNFLMDVGTTMVDEEVFDKNSEIIEDSFISRIREWNKRVC